MGGAQLELDFRPVEACMCQVDIHGPCRFKRKLGAKFLCIAEQFEEDMPLEIIESCA